MKDKIICTHKTISIAIISIGLIIFGWKVIPKAVAITEKPIIYIILLDLFLGGLLAVKVKKNEKQEKIFSMILFLLVPAFCVWNTEHILENYVSNLTPLALCMNYCIYISFFLFLQLFLNHTGWSITIGMIIFTIYALIDAFVGKFRGALLRTSDIFAIQTAMNVSEQYEIILNKNMIISVLLTVAVILIASRCTYGETVLKKRIKKVVLFFFCMAVMILVGFNKEFLIKNELKPNAWNTWASEKTRGGILDFLAGIPFLSVERPTGYNASEVEKILEDKEKNIKNNVFMEEKPDIILIMNESFADLNLLGPLKLTEDPLKFFNSLSEDVVRGNLVVPVFGGGTCNSEFEVITGYSTGFLLTGSFPFTSYIRKETSNLGSQLKKNGYYSIFMHPFGNTGWNRENVYKMFDFDKSLFLDDFKNIDTIREYISDKANYKEVIKEYEKAKKENQNVFLFNVTIQNHGGYSQGEVENIIQIVGEEGKYPEAEVWMTLIQESDKAFQELIEYVDHQEQKMIVCMFGDHLPAIEEELLREVQNNNGKDTIESESWKYTTPFLIYANYDIEEKEYKRMSSNYLPVVLLETAGLPLNPYQKYLKEVYKEFPIISTIGIKDVFGEWYNWEEIDELGKIKEYEKVQYYELFEDKK